MLKKKYVKNCVFAFFQGNLACSWPGNKATDSFFNIPCKDTLFWTKWRPSWIFLHKLCKFFTFAFFFKKLY